MADLAGRGLAVADLAVVVFAAAALEADRRAAAVLAAAACTTAALVAAVLGGAGLLAPVGWAPEARLAGIADETGGSAGASAR